MPSTDTCRRLTRQKLRLYSLTYLNIGSLDTTQFLVRDLRARTNTTKMQSGTSSHHSPCVVVERRRLFRSFIHRETLLLLGTVSSQFILSQCINKKTPWTVHRHENWRGMPLGRWPLSPLLLLVERGNSWRITLNSMKVSLMQRWEQNLHRSPCQLDRFPFWENETRAHVGLLGEAEEPRLARIKEYAFKRLTLWLSFYTVTCLLVLIIRYM